VIGDRQRYRDLTIVLLAKLAATLSSHFSGRPASAIERRIPQPKFFTTRLAEAAERIN
jgi:hypothetical protein